MYFPSRETVERLKRMYPVGCRVQLDWMEDTQAPPVGTIGVVQGVDDAGSVMVQWGTGSSLSVVYGEDKCHVI